MAGKIKRDPAVRARTHVPEDLLTRFCYVAWVNNMARISKLFPT